MLKVNHFISIPDMNKEKQTNNFFKNEKINLQVLLKDSVDTTPEDTNFFLPRRGSNPTIPFAIGVAGFFYLLNPIILFENDKIALGITKEVSLGLGYFGEDRLSFEYSFIFRDYSPNHFRFGYKHDFLLNDLLPSNFLQSTTVFTAGIGAFNDLDGWGVAPEAAFGFSLRNDKLLIYPHIKGRYTYCFREEKSNIIDFSFGVMVGFANPFTDLKIRRQW